MPEQDYASLLVEKGIDGTHFLPLNRASTVIGKSKACDLVVSNPFVSRRHARIAKQGNQFYVEDLGSKNGTYLNGMRLGKRRQRLSPGDRIELIPDSVVVIFQKENATITFVPPATEGWSNALVVDTRSHEVFLRGRKVAPPLSMKEFDILCLLDNKRGEVCSKNEIAVCGWPERRRGDVADQDIVQYIRRLRLKLEDEPSNPILIITVHGLGYKLSE